MVAAGDEVRDARHATMHVDSHLPFPFAQLHYSSDERRGASTRTLLDRGSPSSAGGSLRVGL
eukprot:8617591-Alexandrium_andersonii.AAC.1